MELSKEAQLIIGHCYKDGIPVSCNPKFNEKYDFDGMQVKFTELLLAEISASELVKISNQTEKQVSLNGIAGVNHPRT